MKKLLSMVALAGVLGLSLATGAATRATADQATATPTATPIPTPTTGPTPLPVQGKKLNVVMYVDTVQGAGGNPVPAVGCSLTNLFRQGQVIVFRMWGVNVKLQGTALTPKNVKSAVVIIPGLSTPIPFTYGAHGKAPNPVVSFWTAPWKTAADTPLGVVDFTIVVVTKADKKHKVKSITARYTQRGFASTSRLTITP